jgi:neutral ceramidase
MMGMGQTNQRTHGLHNRLRSRALIVEDTASSQRVVYVTNNLCMTYGDMMQNITAILQQKYGNLYTYANLMISGEHTHSGPAGYSMFLSNLFVYLSKAFIFTILNQ